MLAIFKKSVVDPPMELQSPASLQSSNKAVSPEETMKNFLASNTNNGFSIGFMDKAFLAYSKPPSSSNAQQRWIFLTPHQKKKEITHASVILRFGYIFYEMIVKI